jgi:Tfp pilus assembly protein PilF
LIRGFVIIFAVVALLAVTVEVYLHTRDRARWRKIETAAEHELLGGGLQGLLRARAIALSGAAVAQDAEAAATLALANAMLTSEYGLSEADAALAAIHAIETAPQASQRAQSLKLASRALVEVTAGRPDQAEALARQSVSLGHRQASPLFALGRVRLRQGDPVAASHAFQAALVREPSFIEAKVAWAEVWLEQGQNGRAKEALLAALKHTPDHGRAQLLLAELETTSSEHPSTPVHWEATCARDESKSPFIASACDLARAERAWASHDWDAAIRFADSVRRRRPVEPRLLGGAAQLLASLGTVDLAASSWEEATRVASPALPALRWAKLAIELGRGQLPDFPQDLPAASSHWAPLLKARIALASGGIKALTALLPELQSGRADLAALALAMEHDTDSPAGSATSSLDPVQAYVKGMQARLAGKPTLAADLLAKALNGHGDACRAAGEYLALCRELGRAPDAKAFAWLAKENTRCVNLPAVSAATVKDRARKSASRAAQSPP